MAHVMTRRGTQDNVVTYEHFCDTMADRDAIDPAEINLGTVCVVLEGASGGLEFYIAKSNKEWKSASGAAEQQSDEG